MLTDADTPLIRYAIIRRLDQEPGVRVVELLFERYEIGDRYLADDGVRVAREPFIRVGVLATVGALLQARSKFDLPVPFEHSHLVNEIDEIAEQHKAMRREFFLSPMAAGAERQAKGSGMRGRWARYG